jgi:bifunctional non-homologous end joining protein LigD
VKSACKAIAVAFTEQHPRTTTVNSSKAARGGKTFIDYLRNGRGATFIAPYSTRANEHAAVATPISWPELEAGAKPLDFTIATVAERVRTTEDPWHDMTSTRQRLPIRKLK